jgi:hypothetical protein
LGKRRSGPGRCGGIFCESKSISNGNFVEIQDNKLRATGTSGVIINIEACGTNPAGFGVPVRKLTPMVGTPTAAHSNHADFSFVAGERFLTLKNSRLFQYPCIPIISLYH